MKKTWSWVVALGILLSVSGSAYGQSLKDILKSSAVKDAVTSITGGTALTAENIAGTWTYKNTMVKMESDNALKNVAGNVAAEEMLEKLKSYWEKAGIVEGAFSYTFKSDNTFTNTLKGKNISGTYTVDQDATTVDLSYTLGGKATTVTAYVVLSSGEMQLLFKADKLLDLVTKLSAVTDNTTLKTLSKFAGEYDGMKLGFRLTK